jgi:predicted glycosyltransferase
MDMIDDLQNVRAVDFDPDFTAVVQAADVVVCMGGYNSIAESVYFGKRPIVVPRVPGSEEQVLRAEGFARLGLATVVGPDPLDDSALWDAIDRELSRLDRPGPILAFDGLECIAQELAGLAAG